MPCRRLLGQMLLPSLFERGCADEFEVVVVGELGEIDAVVVGHNGQGLGYAPPLCSPPLHLLLGSLAAPAGGWTRSSFIRQPANPQQFLHPSPKVIANVSRTF